MSHLRCSSCDKERPKGYCSGCNTRYCNPDCQINHWKLHKNECIRLPKPMRGYKWTYTDNIRQSTSYKLLSSKSNIHYHDIDNMKNFLGRKLVQLVTINRFFFIQLWYYCLLENYYSISSITLNEESLIFTSLLTFKVLLAREKRTSYTIPLIWHDEGRYKYLSHYGPIVSTLKDIVYIECRYITKLSLNIADWEVIDYFP